MSVSGDEREQVVRSEVLAPEPAEALAAMLDIDVPHGRSLPPLWHWVYLLERRPHRDLSPDGHPTFGIPAPPGPGRRRMFAGGRVTTHRPLTIGVEATRTTSISSRREKVGRTGPLTFVRVRNDITQAGRIAIVDEQDIVYRSPDSTLPPSRDGSEPPSASSREPSLTLDVDAALLFRFSALTYNAHRIHYDHEYVKQEGYRDLVVHGPLQALMMGELIRRTGIDLVGKEYAYRLVSPMIGPQPMRIVAAEDGVEAGAETRDQRGTVTAVSSLR